VASLEFEVLMLVGTLVTRIMGFRFKK
jgi:hypothetical protein